MLKKIWKIIICFILVFPTFSFAEEKINNFDTVVQVNEDATINVTENITYDFGTAQRHGIYRDIPYKYKNNNGDVYYFDISDIEVDGYNFFVSNNWQYKRIQIGDADTLISGIKNYSIKYKVRGAIGYFDNFDEIYWNATGNEWTVPIDRAEATVKLPRLLSRDVLKISCYEGPEGSKEACDQRMLNDGNLINSVVFSTPKALGIKEGLTIAVGFPKGNVIADNSNYRPSVLAYIFDLLSFNKVLYLPIITFFVMLSLWYVKGRDPKGAGVIIAQYDVPNGLTPLEVSAIMYQKVRDEDVSAEIIDLAVKGFLLIKKSEKESFSASDYSFVYRNKSTEMLSKHEEKLLNSLFEFKMTDNVEVKLSSLKNKFNSKLKDVVKMVISSVISDGYYDEDPTSISGSYFSLAFLLFFIAIFFVGDIFSGLAVISFIILSVIIAVFGFIMPKKTEKGISTYEYILGLKEYLQIAEKDRINFHNAPEKRPEIFEKFLPYAMVLGVEKAWAKEFEDIYTTPPSWYNDPNGGTFNALVFSNNLGKFRSFAGSALSSSPAESRGHGYSGSSGGGFSGGGGGGGGGGSW